MLNKMYERQRYIELKAELDDINANDGSWWDFRDCWCELQSIWLHTADSGLRNRCAEALTTACDIDCDDDRKTG